MSISLEQVRAWGMRDGGRAVAFAKEPEPDHGLEVVQLPAQAMGHPDPGEPGSSARRLCSDWDSTIEGVYVGPRDLPLGGRISPEAAKSARESEDAWDIYWDSFELTLRRANVVLLATYFDHPVENTHIRSLYVVDNDRFPIWNGKRLKGFVEGGDTLIEETYVQDAYLPQKPSLAERLRKLFRKTS